MTIRSRDVTSEYTSSQLSVKRTRIEHDDIDNVRKRKGWRYGFGWYSANTKYLFHSLTFVSQIKPQIQALFRFLLSSRRNPQKLALFVYSTAQAAIRFTRYTVLMLSSLHNIHIVPTQSSSTLAQGGGPQAFRVFPSKSASLRCCSGKP